MTLTKKQIRALRRNTTPFRLLTKEMKAAFLVSEGPIEYYSFSTEKWSFTEEPVWGNKYVYRLATSTEPALIPDVVPWNDIAPGWDYFARDMNGQDYVTTEPPEIAGNTWIGNGKWCCITALANYRRGNTPWDKSLQIRPGVE